MKWGLPTILVIAAFLVLLKLLDMQPQADSSEVAGSRPVAGHGSEPTGGGHGVPADPVPPGATGGGQEAPSTSTSAAPSTSAPPSSPTHPAGTIFGVVVDPAGAGIPDIQVALEDQSGAEVARATTDSAGAYTFPTVGPGSYRLAATDPNHLYTISTQPQVRHDSKNATRSSIQMDRGTGTVTGAVSDSSGRPLATQRVTVSAAAGSELRQSLLTSARGTYRIGGLPPGRWEVSVPDLGQRKAIDLADGSTAEASFAVTLPALLEISLGRSLLHLPEFTGQETITLTPDEDTVTRYQKVQGQDLTVEEAAAALPRIRAELTRTQVVSTEGTASFEALFPGTYQVVASFPWGSRESLGRPADPPVTLTLEEGKSYHQVLALGGSLRGTGIHVSIGWKVALVLLFGALFVVPAILFPAPLQPKGPALQPR